MKIKMKEGIIVKEIKIRGMPTASHRQVCKFVVDRPIIKMGDVAYFRKGKEGKSRLPNALFKLGYITKDRNRRRYRCSYLRYEGYKLA